MDWTIDFRTIILAITWFAAAIVLVSVLVVLRVSYLRGAAHRREAELRRLRAEWDSILNGPPRRLEKLPFIRKAHMLPWMLMWNQAQEETYAKAGGDRIKRGYLNDIALRKNMPARALAWTLRRDVVDRLAAVTVLGHLRESSAVPVLRELCDSPNALISIAAARALLQSNRIFADRFVAMMAERADWPPGKLVAIVGEEQDALAAPLLDVCRTAAPAVVRGLVQYLRYVKPAAALPVIRHLLDTVADPETVTAALKVLTAIGGASDAPIAARLATNENWRVRVQAANALGALGDDSHIPLLTALLDDPHWWVRYRAAQALALVAERYGADLTQIAQDREDRFAREVLTQVIAESVPLLKGAAAS